MHYIFISCLFIFYQSGSQTSEKHQSHLQGFTEITDFCVSPVELWFNNLIICIFVAPIWYWWGAADLWELHFENHHPTPPYPKSFRDVFNMLINGFISCSKLTWAYVSKPKQTKKFKKRMNTLKMYFEDKSYDKGVSHCFLFTKSNFSHT